jgi:hypothetical protein
MIRHTVTFKLKHRSGSSEEQEFLDEARKLSSLPTVQKFACLKEIGKKNNYDFGLSMEFEDMSAYEAYNNHPDHITFVQETWIPQVADFIEIDYQL